MPVYTVHAPVSDGADLAATDRFEFVRDRFNGGLAWFGAGSRATFAVNFVLALLLGFEAASLRRWTLSRRKWRMLDVVVADDEEAAERRFFDRWTAHNRFVSDSQSVERGGPPPTRHVPGQPFSKPPPIPQGGIIGLFPEPGGSR